MPDYITPFTKELDFEKRLADLLTKHGWQPHILINPSEQDLIKNWASIIYNNNRDINRLGDFPLTDSEMNQIIGRVNLCNSPYELNQFINGGMVQIVRDNPDDHVNRGKTVYLKIFSPTEINSGDSVYQIVRQPKFETAHPLASSRRGDMMLLINGIPVIHIELKRSGVDVTQAVNQIRKYTHEGVFSHGIFSMVQIFVAMTPEKTLYFANPGKKENFNSAFQFHWADSNNDEVHDWQQIAANLLNIPMAHQMVGQYTIADDKDRTLKVLRSYQYYATTAICDRVHNINWDEHSHSQKGGFVWHTTGSGKTMTSFKAAQLIAKANDADKVVFLLDRIELSTQSADEYRGFANADDNVLDVKDTASLVRCLESNSKDYCLIVASIQKMSRVNSKNGVPQSTIDAINKKDIVFIVDECHRGSGGEMLLNIKNTFPRALLFGFTGTPVFEENAHGEITTGVIYGDMLHKYTLANGIPDKNVLGFDTYMVDKDENELRTYAALKKCGVASVEEIDDEKKQAIYDAIMDPAQTPMIRVEEMAVEKYQDDDHHKGVMYKIMEDFPTISRGGKFHAMLATRNIPEAIAYYKLFKEHYPDFNVAAIFDDNIDNEGRGEYKEDAILEMLDDYNRRFGTSFQQSTYAQYKKDVAKRLAHKKPYSTLQKKQQLNLLIVVTQMLTGYDSKWVNTLYVDKLMQYIDVVQAFSRTNRIFGPEKPFGIIKYFYLPARMKESVDKALELYVDQPLSVFVDKLEANLENINKAFHVIEEVYKAEGIKDFDRIPKAPASRNKFAKEFCQMTRLIEASKMQGFTWEKDEYEFEHSNGYVTLKMALDEESFLILRQRYKELFQSGTDNRDGDGDEEEGGDVDMYEMDSYITESGAGTIDAEYINSRFIRYVKYLYTEGADSEVVKKMLQDLHHVFATLERRDQRTALTIIHDIQNGNLHLNPDKTIYDYIKDYQKRQVDYQVYSLCEITGLNGEKLSEIVNDDVDKLNINDQGRFDILMRTFNRSRGREFIKRILGREVRRMFVMGTAGTIVSRFILKPEDRAKILFAYHNDNFFLDQNISDETVEQEETAGTETTLQKPTQDNNLTDQEKCNNIATAVMSNLRGLRGWPGTKEVVEAFFKIISLQSDASLDGIAIDFTKVFGELYGRREVAFIDKHVGLGVLLTRFEVYLKKLYFLLKGSKLPQREATDREPTLSEAIHAFPCLWELRTMPGEKYRNLEGCLRHLRSWRNSEEGNGAHASVFLSEEELDTRIKEVVTVYMYVTGASLKDLKERMPELQ